jgi:N-acetylmuramoyl-L-alanine amidase
MLVIHCSATRGDYSAAQIDRDHRARGWAGIGYHFVVRRSGQVEDGRALTKTPAAQRGYNKNSIAICMAGGIDRDGTPVDNFTARQYAALYTLVCELRERFDVLNIVGHNQIPGVVKACPCFGVVRWVYREMVLQTRG